MPSRAGKGLFHKYDYLVAALCLLAGGVTGARREDRPTGYATEMEPPVACTLTEAELREGHRTILDSVRRAVLDISPLPDGYAYRFEAISDILSQHARLVDLVRQCCAFVMCRIVVDAGRPICLEITGLPDAKAIIAGFFGS